MAALTNAQLRWLRDELGASPDDAALQAAYDDRGSIRDVAIAEWRSRRTVLLSQPASVSIPGVASVNFGLNITEISKRIEALTRLDDDPTSDPGEPQDGGPGDERVTVTHLTRSRGR